MDTAADTLRYTDAQRMELRSLVHLAGEAIAVFWPMRTFIHHNPLHGFEDLEFDEALKRGEDVFGGRGYLSLDVSRRFYFEGRIDERRLEELLRSVATEEAVEIGGKKISHLDVLRALLVHGVDVPSPEQAEVLSRRASDRDLLESLSRRLQTVIQVRDLARGMLTAAHGDRAVLGQQMTVAGWCDRTLGTGITTFINDTLIKWCAAFLDEGQAAWAMPLRHHTFYGAWRALSHYDPAPSFCGFPEWPRLIADLPDRPEDVVLESLSRLAIPKALWLDYLSLHLAALPGWTGLIRWRAGRHDDAWQQAYPIDLVKYVGVRLFYERELVAHECRKRLTIEGTFDAIADWMQTYPEEYFLRRERTAGRLPDAIAARVDRLMVRTRQDWNGLAQNYVSEWAEPVRRIESLRDAWRLRALATRLHLEAAALMDTDVQALSQALKWVEDFPESRQGGIWLQALEQTYQDRLAALLITSRSRTPRGSGSQAPSAVRPVAQSVFCIDVRSEPFRRHLEEAGDHETYGIAGFFAVPIRYRAFGEAPAFDLCPVLVKPRHVVREIPRAYHGQAAQAHRAMRRLLKAGQELLHDLKENIITPYVMVEAVGWAFSVPFLGKTLSPVWYRRMRDWLTARLVSPLATTLTVDKLPRQEAREMVATEQRAVIRHVLRERVALHRVPIDAELIESLRREALEEPQAASVLEQHALLTPAERTALVEELRQRWGINPRTAAASLDRITQTGFTLEEQAFFVETALRLIGLTKNFARLVVFCGHGSTSENNPYESALDCGACGGNQGNPNARVLATMANKASVRGLLAPRGIVIPPDTHFCAAQHDTTTDDVRLFDLEDVPPTHRHDLTILMKDFSAAAERTRQERCTRFPDIARLLSPRDAARKAWRRSADWAQVRPEWGLSRNAAILIGRRALTKGVTLEARCFLHSYDWTQDATGKSLEIIMTGPLVVAQWINMEHYFSTVDNDVYGSGSKVYHNIVADVAVMYGTQSDVRIGLSRQTVLDGELPYHEPMRLTAIIEAPRERIAAVIRRNEILQRLFRLQWVHLLALDSQAATVLRYRPDGTWIPMDHERPRIDDHSS